MLQRIQSQSWRAIQRLTKLRGRTKLILGTALVGALISSEVLSVSPLLHVSFFNQEKDKKAPVDYGNGPGVAKTQEPLASAIGQLAVSAPAVPTGGGDGGLFGPAFAWPIIPLHMALLPDGRVLAYGTDQQGNQGAKLVYVIWNPTLGTGSKSFTILKNTTPTDIFCSAGSLMAKGLTGNTSLTGDVLIAAGDVTINGVRNNSDNAVNIFNPSNNSLTPYTKMKFKRWYPSIATLRNGNKLVLGGSATLTPDVGVPTPELLNPTTGWRTLSGISISDLDEWFYPRGILGPDGALTLLQHNGRILRLTTSGAGTMQDTGVSMAAGATYYPSVMMPGFAPYKMLMVRAGQKVQIVDLSTYPPVVTDTANIHYDRIWGNLTLLADGGILATGGSAVYNELQNVAYASEVFNPWTGTWTLGAAAQMPRLYHSATLLLPDGSVLTGGGGAPGPINELNAELYYPDYLYGAGGQPAARPKIVSGPPSVLTLGQSFSFTVGSGTQIWFINLIRLGFNTHSYDAEQRLIPVPFSQTGTTVTGHVDSAPERLPPGYYMLFAFDTNGHPAVAPIVSIPQAVQ
jgi:Domain of unknown function (DUF1929)